MLIFVSNLIQKMDIKQAFKDLLNNKWDDLPEEKKYIWKYRFGNGQLSIKKMTAILQDNGYKKVQTEIWKS